MQRSLPATALAALALTVLATGCATSLSELNGRRYNLTALDTYPVSVVKIDGSSAPLRNPVYVEPGMHQVTVQAPPGGATSVGEQRTIALDVAPCTRYYLVAVKPGRLSSDFSVKVDHEERFGSCKAPQS
jgi:hypothetical protein